MELPVVGCVKEETITYPEVNFNSSKYPSGGLKLDYEFTKEDLDKYFIRKFRELGIIVNSSPKDTSNQD